MTLSTFPRCFFLHVDLSLFNLLVPTTNHTWYLLRLSHNWFYHINFLILNSSIFVFHCYHQLESTLVCWLAIAIFYDCNSVVVTHVDTYLVDYLLWLYQHLFVLFLWPLHGRWYPICYFITNLLSHSTSFSPLAATWNSSTSCLLVILTI